MTNADAWPPPLTSRDCDLRDYVWMPLDCNRLLTSETWVLGSADEKVASLTLWMKSWHQVPAGSIPNNERMLAHISEAGSKWSKVRDHALRGWILCNDGRLYHPVVAEKANESWAHKQAQKARTEAARQAKAARKSSVTEPVTDARDYRTSPAEMSYPQGRDHVATHHGEQFSHSPTVITPTQNRQPIEIGQTNFLSQSLSQAPTEQNRQDKERKKEPSLRSGRAREAGGSRLPENWTPQEPDYPGARPTTLATFRDYWHAKPGAGGRKSDWDATWRNWCRREAERPRQPLHTQPLAEQNRRVLAAVGLNFDEQAVTINPQRAIP